MVPIGKALETLMGFVILFFVYSILITGFDIYYFFIR